MKRLNVLEFFQLGERIGSLGRLTSQKATRGALFFEIMDVRQAVNTFIEQETFSLARDDARELYEALNQFVDEHVVEKRDNKDSSFKDLNEELETWHFASIRKAMEHLTHVFQSECRSAETYFIEPKLIYDTSALIGRASQKIHRSIFGFVQKDALSEIDEAGRCFALEAYTASGFHALRGLELVMGDYYEAIDPSKKTSFNSWSDYINGFEKLEKTKEERGTKFPSRKVISMLDRIRQLDRNPLMHPRDTLDEMSADTLFTISVAAITEMAKDMREMKENPEQLILVATDDKQQILSHPRKRLSARVNSVEPGPSGDSSQS